jgi:hypothetical protein
MTVKLTMLIQQATAVSSPNAPIHRIGGWSESWYYNGTVAQALNVAENPQPSGGGFVVLPLFQARSFLLPTGATIVGARIGVVGPGGNTPTQSLALQYVGQIGEGDPPAMAILCKAQGLGVQNVRRFVLRGLPDANVTEGEYTPTQVFATLLGTFFQSLQFWQFRGRDLSQPTAKIVSITGAGLITFETAVAYNINDFVRILKTRDATGNLRGGRFQVTAVGPGNNNITIANWNFGSTTGGSGRKDAIIFANVDINNVTVSRVVQKKVGRPFVQFRGRRSRRR